MDTDHKLDLQENSKFRVPFDLAIIIAQNEGGNQDREYWLRLYVQCRGAVWGHGDVDTLLKR